MALASPTQGSEYNSFLIYSVDGSKKKDLKQGVVEFQYFEDIFSPIITANLTIVNSAVKGAGGVEGVFNEIGIRGGERIEISITTPYEMVKKKAGDFKLTMYVNGVSNYVAEKQKEIFTLRLVSKESIVNQNTRIIQKYLGKKISELIKDFLKKLQVDESTTDIEESKNPINFIGNMRKPFTLAPMLAARAIPVESKQDTAGFFFWQTWKGFKFKSIESLIKQEVKMTYYYNRIMDTANPDVDKNFEKLLSAIVKDNGDVEASARGGEYSTYRIYFNPHTFGFTGYDSAFKEKWGTMGGKHLGSEPGEVPEVADPEWKRPYMAHRIISGINATGCLEPAVDSEVVQPQTHDIAQSMWRYRSLFTQTVMITVAVNIGLEAGDKIRCEFAKVSSDDDVDKSQSGLYTIKEITHFFSGNKSYSAMKILRDTSGDQTKVAS